MKYAASVSHEEATIQELKTDPQMAAAYLRAVLDDADQNEVSHALNRVKVAFGSVAKLAELSGRADLPAYEPDDGPLTDKQIAALRMDAEKHMSKGGTFSKERLLK